MIRLRNHDWRDDARAFMRSCQELAIPCVDVLRGSAASAGCPPPGGCLDQSQLRCFAAAPAELLRPAVPKPGLPAQRGLRQSDRPAAAEGAAATGCSVFVGDGLRPYPDQWAFLASLRRLPVSAVAFYRAQALRLSVWDKLRVIGCAESFPQHIAPPCGCLQPTLTLLQGQGIRCDLQDERESDSTLNLAFIGRLRHDQCPRKGRRHGSGAGRKLVG